MNLNKLAQTEFSLDIIPGGIPPVVHASQGDIDRRFVATIKKNGAGYDVSDYDVVIRGKKPDGTVFEYEPDNVEDVGVVVSTTEQMTIIPGPVACELVFSQGGTTVATANFVLKVEGAPYDPDALSESDVQTLGELIEQTIGGDIRDEVDNLVTQNPELMLQDNAVTTPKIASGAVTEGKIASNAVTTGKLASGAVTAAKVNADFLKTIENAYVTPEQFGAVGDGATDDTLAVQAALDADETAILNGSYKVRKQTELAYSGNDEPCLVIRKSKKISGVGELIVNIHGQTCFDVRADNVEIEGLTIRGYGLFPKVGASGRGEKSTAGQGWYDPNHSSYQFSLYRNNSVNTSAWNGFEGTSEVWGTFGNGYIGNCGSGIWAYGCKGLYVHDVKISGFNFDGITIGIRANYTTENATIHNCIISNCYNGGIETYNAQHIDIHNNYIHDIGHPSVIANPENYTYVDPGYGIAFGTWQATSGDDYRISRFGKAYCNKVINAVRNALDIHGGEFITFDKNYCENSYGFGCEVGSYSGTGQSCSIECINNKFKNCNVISFRNTETFTNSKESNWRIENNTLELCTIRQYTSYGAIDCVHTGLGNVNVIGNTITNVGDTNPYCLYVNAPYSKVLNNTFNAGILQFYMPHGLIEGNKGFATYKSLSNDLALTPIYKDGGTAESGSLKVRTGETDGVFLQCTGRAATHEDGNPVYTAIFPTSGTTMVNVVIPDLTADNSDILSITGTINGGRIAQCTWAYNSNGLVLGLTGYAGNGSILDPNASTYSFNFSVVYRVK